MMTERSELRVAALERAGYRCEFPRCTESYGLQMAHLKGSGMGGSKYRDVLHNVAMLCVGHHDWLDGRLSPSMRRFDNEVVMRSVLGRWWDERR